MSKQLRNIIPSKNPILYIDIGNSSIKAAFKEGLQWKYPEGIRMQTAADLVEWANRHRQQFDLTVVCSVVPKLSDALKEELAPMQVRVISADDIPGELLQYETPGTLGIDRFFACYGALSHTPGAVVVIDAGTACTIDYMSAESVFMGGVIMPGVGIMESAVGKYAPELPSVARRLPDSWPGRSTEASLQWGLTGAFKDSIEAALHRYAQRFGEFELIITGGDAEWLNGLLGRESKVRKELIFEGMYRYLEDYL